jgi:arginine-tRNA-protein transferase
LTQHSRDTPQFYLTAPSPCPYLPGRHERKVFTHLVGDRAGDLNDLLTHGGFRRSQSIAYRPACDQCRACVSVRVIANEFRPSRNFRKVLARNADIIGEQRSPVPTSEQYSVFRAYLDARHRHGGMADMTVLDYAMMVEDSHVETRIIEYRRRGVDSSISGRGEELLEVALTDVLSDGLSMVYSFFEPSQESRSLGTFMILDHIARAAPGPALRLSRLLDRWLQEDGLQGPLPAAAATRAVRLAPHRGPGRRSLRAAGLMRRR